MHPGIFRCCLSFAQTYILLPTKECANELCVPEELPSATHSGNSTNEHPQNTASSGSGSTLLDGRTATCGPILSSKFSPVCGEIYPNKRDGDQVEAATGRGAGGTAGTNGGEKTTTADFGGNRVHRKSRPPCGRGSILRDGRDPVRRRRVYKRRRGLCA